MKVYLQFADGEEKNLEIMEPDPKDGSFVICGLPEGTKLGPECWIRICPADNDDEMVKEVPVVETDNRDPRTTWLWINDKEYVEVDPYDLVENSIENLPEEEQEQYRSAFQAFKDL